MTPLNYPWSTNYYHWLLDILPLALRAGAKEVLVNTQVDKVRPYIRQTLDYLGLSISYTDQMQEQLHPRTWHMSESVQILNQTFRPEPNHLRPKGVLVDRPTRQLVEEDMAFLEGALGLTRVKFEEYSVLDQIRMMRFATRMVGVCGAGLTNMIWMPAGSLVLEFRSPAYPWSNCFGNLADACGHKRLLVGASFHSGELHPYKHKLALDNQCFPPQCSPVQSS